MTSVSSFEKEKNRLVQERCQGAIADLLKDEDNKYCVDCDAKSPRWASWNLGIFLCIRCAGIHRNLGVHISKVKSVNLDSWTPQQVACIQQMGNSRARAVYEANYGDNMRRPQTDSALEQFIRAKYEAKKYIAKEWVEPPMPNPTWEADIEKQLRKKREKKSTVGRIEFPAAVKSVPKTSGVSPKPLPKAPGGRTDKASPGHAQARRTSSSSSGGKPQKEGPTKDENEGSNVQDLLRLDYPTQVSPSSDQSDLFGDFLAAPVSNVTSTVTDPQTTVSEKQSTESDEVNFFSQVAPVQSSSEKLSKDSILALYAKTSQPSTPAFGTNSAFSSMRPSFVQGNPALPNSNAVQTNMPLNMTYTNATNMTAIPGYNVQSPRFSSNVPMTSIPQQGTLGFQQVGHNLGIGAGGYPVMHPGIQLSPANPFAQMQSQMSNMSIGAIPNGAFNPSQQTTLMGNMNPHSHAALPKPNPGFIGTQNHNGTLAANLWQ